MNYKIYNAATDTTNGNVLADALEAEIAASSIVPALDFTTIKSDGSVRIQFVDDLSESEFTELDSVVANHLGNTMAHYEKIVENAIGFFSHLIVQYAAKNITLGITYYNKTKDVSDYLKDVMRYGQSGSLYEVINEIKALHTAGFPAGLAPYVDEPTMQKLLNEVEEYLNVTPLTDWT